MTIPKFLQEKNYPQVNIIPYEDDRISVKIVNNAWKLFVDGVQQNLYQLDHSEGFQVYSHYELAYGDVICTGLGFGIREQWIASKPEVTKVTVIENSKSVIDYHKSIGTQWNEKIEIIEADANFYRGTCNFLAIDHYENIPPALIVETVKRVSSNISCDIMWFWQLENLLLRWEDKAQAYRQLIKIPGMEDLPYLPDDVVQDFYDTFHGKYNNE